MRAGLGGCPHTRGFAVFMRILIGGMSAICLALQSLDGYWLEIWLTPNKFLHNFCTEKGILVVNEILGKACYVRYAKQY